MVDAAAAPPAEVTTFWFDSATAEVTWRFRACAEAPAEAAAAETRLTGLLVSKERFCGLRNNGAVTRLPPAFALANKRFPLASREVIGRDPPDARA